MCGICNVVRCITGRTGGCRCRENACAYEYRMPRCEPRMNVRCASGIGTSSECPCHTDYDTDCGCRRNCDCDCD